MPVNGVGIWRTIEYHSAVRTAPLLSALPAWPMPTTIDLRERLAKSAFAFRGYNVTNLGRTPELLAHPAYGPTVKRYLSEASAIYAQTLDTPLDLVTRVRDRQESTLETFAADIALIVAVELAQIDLLREFFDVDYSKARLAFGYSLGEMAALVCGGVYAMRDALPPLLRLAGDSVELARDVTMGVVFSRGAALDFDAVARLCLEINRQGRGVISVSAYLSPNTVLVLGQGDTVERFRQALPGALSVPTFVRTNRHRWPPLHTSILWEQNIPNRAATMMHTLPGGRTQPIPPILSLVTGKASYNDYNSRELLGRWIDHPQRLWDAIYETLSAGIDTVIHVGPEANLIPATYKRLSDNVRQQLAGRSFNKLGLRAISGLARRPWLSKLLSSRTALLRAPFVQHVVLEDWLLEQEV